MTEYELIGTLILIGSIIMIWDFFATKGMR